MIGQIKSVQTCTSATVVGCNGSVILTKHKDLQSLITRVKQNEPYCHPGQSVEDIDELLI